MGDETACSLSLLFLPLPKTSHPDPYLSWHPLTVRESVLYCWEGHCCPWEQTPTSRTSGNGIPALHSFHILFIMLLSQIYFPVVSSQWKMKEEQRKLDFIIMWLYWVILTSSENTYLSNPYPFREQMLSWKCIVFTSRMLIISWSANKHVIYHWLSWWWI